MVGDRCFCTCERPHGFDAVAYMSEVSIRCEHVKAGDAVALVHLLADFKIEAHIADGYCEWNPLHPDLKALQVKRKTRRS